VYVATPASSPGVSFTRANNYQDVADLLEPTRYNLVQAAAAKRQANDNKKRKRLDECNDIIESARKKAHGMV
jgi:hypothetical protein